MFKEKKDKLIAVLFVLLGFLLYSLLQKSDKSDTNNLKAYQQTIDSLHKRIDSLSAIIKVEDSTIVYYKNKDRKLSNTVSKLKQELNSLKKKKDTMPKKIDSLSSVQLVSFYNQRYPNDTTTEKLELAKPVLNSAAKDLIELDYSKEIISVQDSIINVDSIRIAGKDSTISSYERKELLYKNQISNHIEIEDNYKKSIDQYKQDQKIAKKNLRNAKLKTYAAIGLFISYIIIRN
jgi:hypothetical protein